VLEEVEVAPSLPLGVIGRAVGRTADRAGKAATRGEVDFDVDSPRLRVEVGATDGPGRRKLQHQLQSGIAHSSTSLTLPMLSEPGVAHGTALPLGHARTLRATSGSPKADS
jgi:hypothetical protein